MINQLELNQFNRLLEDSFENQGYERSGAVCQGWWKKTLPIDKDTGKSLNIGIQVGDGSDYLLSDFDIEEHKDKPLFTLGTYSDEAEGWDIHAHLSLLQFIEKYGTDEFKEFLKENFS